LKKLERAKIAPPPDWWEGQVRTYQMLCDSRAAIISTGQRNHPPSSTASVFILWPDKGHST